MGSLILNLIISSGCICISCMWKVGAYIINYLLILKMPDAIPAYNIRTLKLSLVDNTYQTQYKFHYEYEITA